MQINHRHILLIMLGNFILAISSAFFLLPSKVISGGVNGIGVILEKFMGWNPVVCINVGILLCFLLGVLFLGKQFALKTMLSSILFPTFLKVLTMFTLPILPEIIASIFGGICTGIGIGLVIRAGGSTGGMDVPPLILHKYTKISLSILVLLCDACIVLAGVFVYGPVHVFIGLLSVFTCSKVLHCTLGE